MTKINENYLKLQGSYLFSEIAKRVAAYTEQTGAQVIRMGIGDVTRPLVPSVVEAMRGAIDEMATPGGFRGYGPEQGYDFLRNAIAANDFAGLDISPDEIFISDGSKCDTANIGEIFSSDCRIAVTDPVYPVYVDTNVMSGRTGEFDGGRFAGIEYLPSTVQNGFVPPLPKTNPDLLYICSPNNPTGTALSKAQLTVFVDWAINNKAIILFDAAYERFITSPDVPHSIYEINGAKQCAIEFRSFSKTAGFTGTRCAFTVVPKTLFGYTKSGESVALSPLWNRRHTTKFNGVSYIIQRGAEAVYTPQGKAEIDANIKYYLENAKIILDGLASAGISAYGGADSPYVWFNAPNGYTSWEFFDVLLKEASVVSTPGSGFGSAGEGFLRLTAFNTKQNTLEAMARIAKL